jgi:alpha-galactosidase
MRCPLRRLDLAGTLAVRAEELPATAIVHGVEGHPRQEDVIAGLPVALYAWVRLRTSPAETAGPVQLPGLDDAATYRVRLALPEQSPRRLERHPLPVHDGVTGSGRLLGAVGLQLPALHAEHALVIEVERV